MSKNHNKYDIIDLQLLATNLVETSITSKSIVLLQGDLGVGKTTFAFYLLKMLIDNDDEYYTSPTFNIIHEYFSMKKNCKVFHCDLYRIKKIDELYNIGFDDMLKNDIMIIEWPQIAYALLKNINKSRLIMINLSFNDDDTRNIEISYSCNI